ncbi:MAG: hypothetical protein RIT28_4319 [Pseudomonadota bacterium]|jgi:hypothetical protein
METVAQRFEKYLQTLNLTENQDAAARDQRDRVLEGVKKRLSIKSVFISGSFGRLTSVRPLHDIDLFLELEPSVHGGPRAVTPKALLEQVKRAVEEMNPGKTAKLQSRSVNIEFTGTGIGYDLVPAFRESDSFYLITDEGGWKRTNPRVHKERTKAAHERAGGMGLGLIRGLKGWNNRNGKNIKSFHLELMIIDLLTAKPSSYAEGFATLFTQLPSKVMGRCVDPAEPTNDVAEGTDPQKRALGKAALEKAAELAKRARAFELAGDHTRANALWREIFGESF